MSNSQISKGRHKPTINTKKSSNSAAIIVFGIVGMLLSIYLLVHFEIWDVVGAYFSANQTQYPRSDFRGIAYLIVTLPIFLMSILIAYGTSLRTKNTPSKRVFFLTTIVLMAIAGHGLYLAMNLVINFAR